MPKNINLRAAILVAICLSASAQAGETCSTRTASGTYVLKCSGDIALSPTGPTVPFAYLALQTRDKSGNVHGSGEASIGGMIGVLTHDETGVVNPDCTAEFQGQNEFPGFPTLTAHFFDIVSADGKVIQIISTDPGNTMTCTATRLDNNNEDNHNEDNK